MTASPTVTDPGGRTVRPPLAAPATDRTSPPRPAPPDAPTGELIPVPGGGPAPDGGPVRAYRVEVEKGLVVDAAGSLPRSSRPSPTRPGGRRSRVALRHTDGPAAFTVTLASPGDDRPALRAADDRGPVLLLQRRPRGPERRPVARWRPDVRHGHRLLPAVPRQPRGRARLGQPPRELSRPVGARPGDGPAVHQPRRVLAASLAGDDRRMRRPGVLARAVSRRPNEVQPASVKPAATATRAEARFAGSCM